MKVFAPSAVIFDWDGVIVDSSAHHERSWEVVAERRGLPLPEGHFEKSFGKRGEEIIPGILGWAQAPAEVSELLAEKEEAYRALIREHGIEPLPGVVRLLDFIAQSGIRCGVGSSTPRDNLDAAIDLLKFSDRFEIIVSGDDVSRGKPDPEVFVRAASLLGTEPAKSLVFEDSFSGIEASRRGGIPVIAVATTNPLERLGEADAAVWRLSDLVLANGTIGV